MPDLVNLKSKEMSKKKASDKPGLDRCLVPVANLILFYETFYSTKERDVFKKIEF